MRFIGNELLTGGEGVDYPHEVIRNTEIPPVGAAFRTVHTAAFGSVSVIENLGRIAGEDCAFLGLEDERGDSGAVLSEINDEGLSRGNDHLLSGSELAGDLHLAVFSVLGSFRTVPVVRFDGGEGYVPAEVHLSSLGGEDFSLEFGVDFRGGEFLRSHESERNPGVIFLTVENSRMEDGTGNAGFPVFRVGTVHFLCAIGVGQFENTPEGGFLSDHPLMSTGGYDLVSPPSRCYLYREDVLLA